MSTVTLPPPSEISSLSLSHEPLRPPKVKNQNGEGKYDKHTWTWDWEESPLEAPCSDKPCCQSFCQPHPHLATVSLVDLRQAEASGLTCHNCVDP